MTELEKATTKITKVKVTANLLNVRKGPSTKNAIVGITKKNTTHEILEIKDGWGRIAKPDGWISLVYTAAI